MAILYVRSTDGNNADDGSTWALAKATVAGALAAASAGDTIYVSQSHAETASGDLTLTSPGTAASPVKILCVNDGAEPPTALATTATVARSTNGSDISFSGFAYCYGVSFTVPFDGLFLFQSDSPWYWKFDTCSFNFPSGGSSYLHIGYWFTSVPDGQLLHLVNTPINFNGTSQKIYLQCRMIWENTPSALGSGTMPTTLFQHLNTARQQYCDLMVRGCDLSQAGSGKNLVNVAATGNRLHQIFNCKLGPSVSLTTGSVASQGDSIVRVVNCDSADTNWRYYYQDYQGVITNETTIVRTGGSSDGTTAFSRKAATSANTQFYSPLVLDPIVLWNESTGSALTATVEIVTDNVTLTDAEAWLEVEYLGTSGYPLSLFANDRAADILATPANQTTSTETWTTTGLTTPVKQKLAVTFTPQEKGPIKLRVHVAKASTTVYVCQKATVA